MDMYPTIKVEVEGVRHAIVQAFTDHNHEIEVGIEKALNEINIGDIVTNEVNRLIPYLIKEAVEKAITTAVNSIMWDWNAKTQIAEGLETLVMEAMTEKVQRRKKS